MGNLKPEAGRRTPNAVLTTVFDALLIFAATTINCVQCGSQTVGSDRPVQLCVDRTTEYSSQGCNKIRRAPRGCVQCLKQVP